ncbi:hypothetical protein [Aliidiomarina soli]|uniref:Uncharacterized protein n=1 Tax=Aliidiomarina soli TaxID=1928574 RepID=A0A432WFD1_9GAMM|nr:hypothetical protein [Aliidiomarina soli]RUO32512.1 hypothetical protein CWE14_10230 [Aliidiomarina soli]
MVSATQPEFREQQLTSSMLALGTERLALIGKHSSLLMQAYLQGELADNQLSDRAIRKLVQANLIYQPDESRGFLLRPQLADLIASMVTDENRRHINADVADKLETIRLRVKTYRDAQQRGDTTKAQFQLQLLTGLVHDLGGQFGEAMDSLWHRLNSNFGFVASLADKIRENHRAQQQIGRLLDGLNYVDFAELIALGEGDVHLRKLLVSQLQRQLNAHHSSLLEVQRRLVQLMGRYREQQARSVLLTNMASFLREHSNFQVGDYAWRSQVPELINQAQPILPAAAISLDQHAALEVATGLMASMPRPTSNKESVPSEQAERVATVANPQVEARQQALKADVEALLLHVVDQGKQQAGVSALQYLREKNLSWDAEVWLLQILGEYQSLPPQQRHLFSLRRDEQRAHPFNDLLLIADLELSFQPASQGQAQSLR